VAADPNSNNSLDNILDRNGCGNDPAILSIDIDSSDLDIWESLTRYKPKIVVIEINSSIPPGVYLRQGHHVNGNSFTATLAVGKVKGYSLVAHTGNMIFVRDDLVPSLQINRRYLDFPELLSPKKPGEIVGELSKESALDLGLSTSTKIVVGGADHVLSAYAAGLISEGDCLVKLGGAGDVLAVSDNKFLDERLYLDAHPAPNKWLPNGCMATSGSLLRWEQSLLNGIDLVALDKEAESSKPGALLTLPYFLGEKSPLHDPNLRGAIAGLHLGTTRDKARIRHQGQEEITSH
jgi:xylulokinase